MMKMTGPILCLLGTVALGACNRTTKPDMTIQQFMAKKVDPASKVYFNAVQFISDETGNHDIKPQTDADWAKVQQAAVDLQAYGKELQTPGYSDGRREDWKKMSADLVTVSQQAEAAAKARNPDKVFEVAGTVYAVCDACHMAYPKDGENKGGGSAS